MTIKIQSPIWKTRSVGIPEHKLKTGFNEIEILCEDRDGKRLFPNIYKMSKQKIMAYPLRIVKTVRLRIIPILDLLF